MRKNCGILSTVCVLYFGNYAILLSQFCQKNSVKSNFSCIKELNSQLILWKNLCCSKVSAMFPLCVHKTQCGKTRNSLTRKIFRQINSLVTYSSSKTFTFTIFLCYKCVRENFRNFHNLTENFVKLTEH